jgi:FAD/FMN-containing dehydrogenase
MTDLELRTTSGHTAAVPEGDIDAFRARLRGVVVGSADPAYDEARAVWNGIIDRRPGVIVRCVGVADVIASVRFARDHDLLVAVRGGGHNVSGNAVCHGGLVIVKGPFTRSQGLTRDDALDEAPAPWPSASSTA